MLLENLQQGFFLVKFKKEKNKIKKSLNESKFLT